MAATFRIRDTIRHSLIRLPAPGQRYRRIGSMPKGGGIGNRMKFPMRRLDEGLRRDWLFKPVPLRARIARGSNEGGDHDRLESCACAGGAGGDGGATRSGGP